MHRWRHILLLGISLATTALTGCQPEEDTAGSNDAITDIKNTPVERQTIGNCWIYATTGWAETIHLAATHEAVDLSEAYLTYWRIYELVTSAFGSETRSLPMIGGEWEWAIRIIAERGLMREADFIPEESGSFAMVRGVVMGSGRQSDAYDQVNRELANDSSALRRAVRKRDRAGVRQELDKAWKLRPEVIAELDKAFGPDGREMLGERRLPAPSKIIRPRDFMVAASDPETRTVRIIPLSETFPAGSYAWQRAYPPVNGETDPEARRAYERRLQRALHDGMPLPIAWNVDGHGKDASGVYRASKLKEKGPSPKVFGHFSLITDYSAENVPGFGTLAAGTEETRPAALAAALDDRTRVSFFRAKNSWGVLPGDPMELVGRLLSSSVEGYNDLEPGYLYATGFSVVLPPGY